MVWQTCLKQTTVQVQYLNAVELVPARVPGETLAHVAAHDVHAARVRVAVVAEQTASRLALVHVCIRQSIL